VPDKITKRRPYKRRLKKSKLRPARGKKPPKSEPDELDIQIIALRRQYPRATLRYIAEIVGVSIYTVWSRIHRLPEQEWYKVAKVELENLVHAALGNYSQRLIAGDPAAAHDLLYGLGLLQSRSEQINRNIPVSVADIIRAYSELSTAEQDRVIGGIQDDPEREVQPDD